jgi:hypothetical protein
MHDNKRTILVEMAMIVWGWRNRTKNLEMGQFDCPNCNRTNTYQRKVTRQWFTIYFVIPLFPTSAPLEYIECTGCHHTYQIDVLNYKAKSKPTDAAAQLNTLKARLQGGASVEYVVRDLTAAGVDRQIALDQVKTAIGTTRVTCPTCQLSYAEGVSTCKECGATLQAS